MSKKKTKVGEAMTDEELLNIIGPIEEYCDDCGEVLVEHSVVVVFVALPFNVSSANKGESGTICGACWDKHKATKYWETKTID